MYYKIKEDGIFKIDLGTFWDSGECVGLNNMTESDNEKIFWEMEENQMEQSRYTTLDLRLKEIGLQQEF